MQFMCDNAPDSAEEIRLVYIESMGRTISALFRAYHAQLKKLEVEMANRHDLIAVEVRKGYKRSMHDESFERRCYQTADTEVCTLVLFNTGQAGIKCKIRIVVYEDIGLYQPQFPSDTKQFGRNQLVIIPSRKDNTISCGLLYHS